MTKRTGKKMTAIMFAAAISAALCSTAWAANSKKAVSAAAPKTAAKIAANQIKFSVKEASGTYYVSNTIGVNVRKAPSAASKRLGGLYLGDAVTVTGRVMENGKENGWVRIKYNNGEAYVWNTLTETKPAVSSVKVKNKQVVENGVSGETKKKQSWITFDNKSNTTRIKAARGERVKGDDVFTVNVKSGYLALRSNADSNASNIIGQLNQDVSVTVETYGTQFDYVYVPSLNKNGYVNNDYLR